MYNLVFMLVVPLVLISLFTLSNINSSFFNTYFGEPQKLIGFITALLTYLYVILTGRMVWQMKETSEEESRPYIIGDIEFEGNLGFFEIKNIGKLPAKELKISVTPDLQIIGGRSLSMVANIIAIVPPGKIIKAFINTDRELLKDDAPKEYKISLEYKWAKNKVIKEEYAVDLRYRKGLLYKKPKGVNDIAESLESINSNFKKVIKNDGIYVKTRRDLIQDNKVTLEFIKEVNIVEVADSGKNL